MALAALLGSCGVAVIYYNKILNNKPHFTSWHGLIGVITIAFFVSQALGGVFVLYPAAAFGFLAKSSIKKYHILCGCVLALLGYVSFLLGLYSNWFVGKVSSKLWFVCVAPIFYWMLSVPFYNLKRLI